MSIFEQIELEDKIMEICKTLHESLCKESQDPDDSIMSSSEVNQLEPVEALKHMTEAIKDLLSHERNIKIFRQFKSFHNSEAVQSTLQKLEADIREHVKIENQLKLYCENYESLIEDQENELKNLESFNKRKLEEAEAENESLKIELKELEAELFKVKKKDFDLSREPESEIPSESDYRNLILAEKSSKVKKLKEIARNREARCKELTKENKEMLELIRKAEGEKEDIDFPTYSYYQVKYREKCREVSNLRKRIKNQAKSQSPFLNTIRNSCSPISKRSLNHGKKKSPVRSSSRNSKSLYRSTQRNEKHSNL
jgi:hypothetical protein